MKRKTAKELLAESVRELAESASDDRRGSDRRITYGKAVRERFPDEPTGFEVKA